MADEPIIKIPKTAKQKLLFYTTAFFILLGIFSLFGFMFLVPFIIEPAYTTIKMDFDQQPAECFTVTIETKRGLSNCSWTSCREGCTREVYECTQILVNYRHPNVAPSIVVQNDDDEPSSSSVSEDYNTIYIPEDEDMFEDPSLMMANNNNEEEMMMDESADDLPYHRMMSPTEPPPWITDTKSRWFFGARLFPNVKGCGYPPFLNCTIFNNTHVEIDRI